MDNDLEARESSGTFDAFEQLEQRVDAEGFDEVVIEARMLGSKLIGLAWGVP